ncbi:MAG: FAD:protein FMN transferase [Pirellulaceae bacterium]|jgi:thiamine biosynthesis lipoprotein
MEHPSSRSTASPFPTLVLWVVAGFVGLWMLARAWQAPISTPQGQIAIQGQTMGTTYTVRLHAAPANLDANQLKRQIDQRLEDINRMMSTYLPESEVSRFTSHPVDQWFEISTQTAKVVQQALELSRLSGGYYDITVAPLVNLWGFGPEGQIEKRPSEEQIALAKKKVGFQYLEVEPSTPAIRKTLPGLAIDLSSIAKGYGVDQVAELLDQLKVKDYFVEIGGEVRVLGRNPSGVPWRIGIEAPLEDIRQASIVLPMAGGSVATSGDYRNFFEDSTGHRYSHTIDPHTAQPVQSTLASVTVIADQCSLADGRATTIMALGSRRGMELAEKEGWAVLLMDRVGKSFRWSWSFSFQERFPELIERLQNENANALADKATMVSTRFRHLAGAVSQ